MVKKKQHGKAKSNKQKSNKKVEWKSKKQHKTPTWKAGYDDPVRLAVEADGSRTIVDMEPDGNCLFRAISDQLFKDYGNKCDEVRSEVCDYLEDHEDDFIIFLALDDGHDEDAEDFESYVEIMREDGTWGGHVELVAAARSYSRSVRVYSDDLAAFTISHGDGKPTGPELCLSYHDNDHYNSVRSSTEKAGSVPTKGRAKPGEQPDCSEQTDDKDTEETIDKTQSSDSVKTIKKGGPCPCGSGLKYKKCCLKKKKHAARVAHSAQSQDEEDSVETSFRELQL